MKIDYFSDPHFDFWFTPKQNLSYEKLDAQFKHYIPSERGEVLLIAGDLGHYNRQNIDILKAIKKLYCYKHIICILGNHDYYLSTTEQRFDFKKNSFARVEQMRELINEKEGLYCLDGNIVEIDGVRFGGCDSWYSDAYLRGYFPFGRFTHESNNQMWQNVMNDWNYLYGVEHYKTIYNIEKPKMKAVHDKCDVMITHVNPSYLKRHLDPQWANDQSSTFFTFNGHDLMKNGTMKYWIFGHTHSKIEYEHNGVKCLCNPLGYPGEHRKGLEPFKIESFEV
jgi:DNA repair exonuclease SbcCD nuclease subunit